MADDKKDQPKPASPPPPPADPKAEVDVRTNCFSDGYDDRTQKGKKDGR